MDVFVARSGGLAGIRLTWHVRVDEQPDADDWFVLIEEIPWNEVPPAPPEPDRFTWDIRCEPTGSTESSDAAPDATAKGTEAPDAAARPPQPRPDESQHGAAQPDGQHVPAVKAEVTLAERQLTGPWRELVDRVRQATEPKREAPRAPRA